MAALLLPAPLRLNAPFPPVNRAARDASAANHARFPPHARTAHARRPSGNSKRRPKRVLVHKGQLANFRRRLLAFRGLKGTVPRRAARRRSRSRHRPQCRKIFSITLPCGGSMNEITFIVPPHCGHAKGSTSYTRLMSIAQVWSQRPLAAAACNTGGASRSRRLAAHAARLVRVPAVIANQVPRPSAGYAA